MPDHEIQLPRNTKRGSLYTIRSLGFYPRTVIDVGAQTGTHEFYECFPLSKHLLIEPVQEHQLALTEICRNLNDAELIVAAATKGIGPVTLSVSPNRRFAAIVDARDPNDDDCYRTVPGITLDSISAERNLQGPYLIKIDVDGRELDVLIGARRILEETEYIVIESTLFGQFHDVIDYMRESGFVVYDILDPLYRPLDIALWQVDLAFVKRESPLRRDKRYADEKTIETMMNR